MPYKDKIMKSQRQKERRHSEVPSSWVGDEAPEGVPPTEKVQARKFLIHRESKEKFLTLPQETQSGIINVLFDRRGLGLFDDSVERIDRATSYLSGS